MKEIEFSAVRKQSNNCCCDCCFDIGSVTKIRIPISRYYDSKELSTRYKQFWICDDCLQKLIIAMQNPGKE